MSIIGYLMHTQHEFIPEVEFNGECTGSTGCANHTTKADCPSSCTWTSADAQASHVGTQCILTGCAYLCFFVLSTYFWIYVHNDPYMAHLYKANRPSGGTELTESLMDDDDGIGNGRPEQGEFKSNGAH